MIGCTCYECEDLRRLGFNSVGKPAVTPHDRAHQVAPPKPTQVLPSDAAARNEYPMADGLLYYFSSALAEIAKLSKIANDQHNPGEAMHWARGKSKDHANKIVKHLLDSGSMDSDGTRHSTKLAWRALALLQIELEEQAGAPRPRNAY